MMSLTTVIVFAFCTLVTVGYCHNTDCSTHPFADACLQRRVIKRSLSHLSFTHCRKAKDFEGSIVLINVLSTDTNDSVANIENTTQSDERNETCLLQKLRPKFTGYNAISNVPIDYRVCEVNTTEGFLILEYTCIKAEAYQTIQLPQCSGSFNGSRLRIETHDFPNSGFNTTGDNCNCSVSTGAPFINVTNYYMHLTKRQSLAIADVDGLGLNFTDIKMGDVMETESLLINGTVFLTWSSTEKAIVNSSKFWIEIEADGAVINVSCYQPQAYETTEASTPTTIQVEHTTPPMTNTTDNMPVANATAFVIGRFTSDDPGGSEKANKSLSGEQNDGGSFPLIPVIIGGSAGFVVLLIIMVIVCRKNTRDKMDDDSTIAMKVVDRQRIDEATISVKGQHSSRTSNQTPNPTATHPYKEQTGVHSESRQNRRSRDKGYGEGEHGTRDQMVREEAERREGRKKKTRNRSKLDDGRPDSGHTNSDVTDEMIGALDGGIILAEQTVVNPASKQQRRSRDKVKGDNRRVTRDQMVSEETGEKRKKKTRNRSKLDDGRPDSGHTNSDVTDEMTGAGEGGIILTEQTVVNPASKQQRRSRDKVKGDNRCVTRDQMVSEETEPMREKRKKKTRSRSKVDDGRPDSGHTKSDITDAGQGSAHEEGVQMEEWKK